MKTPDPLLLYGVDLLIAGYKPVELRSMLGNVVDTTFERDMVPVGVLKMMGNAALAFGMVGTLIGLIVMLEGMGGDASAMGLAVALVTTLYGVLLSRPILLPAAAKAQQRNEAARFKNDLLAEGFCLLAEDRSPQFIADRMNGYLDPAIRVQRKKAGTACGPASGRPPSRTRTRAGSPQVEDIVEQLGLRDEVDVASHARGLRIDMASTVLYEEGQVELSGEAERIVGQLAGVVAELATEGTVVEVESHTDDTPVSAGSLPSSWELSAHRAGAVVRVLEKAGVPSKRLRIVGYGQALPVAKNRDGDGEAIPENQARNRRIAIVVWRP